ISLLCAPATFSSKTSTASTGMARPITTMSGRRARICGGRNWCCRPSLSITSPTTQVNNSCRMVEKSSSSVCHRFINLLGQLRRESHARFTQYELAFQIICALEQSVPRPVAAVDSTVPACLRGRSSLLPSQDSACRQSESAALKTVHYPTEGDRSLEHSRHYFHSEYPFFAGGT